MDLLASKLREEVFTAIRAHTAATVSEAEAATLAILRLVENAAPSDDETCTGCNGDPDDDGVPCERCDGSALATEPKS